MCTWHTAKRSRIRKKLCKKKSCRPLLLLLLCDLKTIIARGPKEFPPASSCVAYCVPADNSGTTTTTTTTQEQQKEKERRANVLLSLQRSKKKNIINHQGLRLTPIEAPSDESQKKRKAQRERKNERKKRKKRRVELSVCKSPISYCRTNSLIVDRWPQAKTGRQ